MHEGVVIERTGRVWVHSPGIAETSLDVHVLPDPVINVEVNALSPVPRYRVEGIIWQRIPGNGDKFKR